MNINSSVVHDSIPFPLPQRSTEKSDAFMLPDPFPFWPERAAATAYANADITRIPIIPFLKHFGLQNHKQ
jgi:hypothetical protein